MLNPNLSSPTIWGDPIRALTDLRANDPDAPAGAPIYPQQFGFSAHRSTTRTAALPPAWNRRAGHSLCRGTATPRGAVSQRHPPFFMRGKC
jgi:hypothetical protein